MCHCNFVANPVPFVDFDGPNSLPHPHRRHENASAVLASNLDRSSSSGNPNCARLKAKKGRKGWRTNGGRDQFDSFWTTVLGPESVNLCFTIFWADEKIPIIILAAQTEERHNERTSSDSYLVMTRFWASLMQQKALYCPLKEDDPH